MTKIKNTMGLESDIKNLVIVKTEEQLMEFIKKNEDYFVIGHLSNAIIAPVIKKRNIVKLSGNFNKIQIEGSKVIAGSGVKMNRLVRQLAKNNLSGLEWACDLPGSVGGAISMNASCFSGNLQDVLDYVYVINKKGNKEKIEKDRIIFSYRKSNIDELGIITHAVFILNRQPASYIEKEIEKISKQRRNTQPRGKSCGCIFKNASGVSAGELIEKAGLKGYSINGAKISEKHANYIINYNNAEFDDIMKLIELIKIKIFKEFNIKLELEVKILND